MQDDEQASRNLVAEWQRASAAGDVTTLMSLHEAVFPYPFGDPEAVRCGWRGGRWWC